MIALKISINGEVVTVAGAEDLGVFNAHVEALGILGSESLGVDFQKKDGIKSGYNLYLECGGLTNREKGKANEHLTWLSSRLELGDEIEFEIVDVDITSDPIESDPA